MPALRAAGLDVLLLTTRRASRLGRRLLIVILAATLTGIACGSAVSDAGDELLKAESNPEPIPRGYRDLTIPAGTLVPMSLTRALSSDANATGDRVTAELTHAMSVDGFEVLPAGTMLEGHVTQVVDDSSIGARARIVFSFTRLQSRGREYDVSIAPFSHPVEAAGEAAIKAVRLLPGADVTSALVAPLTLRIHVG